MISLNRRRKHELLYDRYGSSKKVEYARLINAGYYLPPINSPAVNREYLLGIREDKFVSKRVQAVVEYEFAHFSKEIAYCVLAETANEISLGFDITQLPPKQWMINMAYTLNNEHPAFIPAHELQALTAIARDHQRYQNGLLAAFNRVLTPEQLQQRYNPVIKRAYKEALKNKMKKLIAKYRFCAVDLNNPIIN